MTVRRWEPDELDQVVQLFKLGHTASQSARLLTEAGIRKDCGPITRNAIVGIWDRLHLQRGSNQPTPKKLPTPNKSPPSKQTVKQPPLLKRVTIAATLPAPRDAKSFEDIQHRECKYPFGDPRGENFRYCGNPVERASYCHQHYQLCYTPPRISTTRT